MSDKPTTDVRLAVNAFLYLVVVPPQFSSFVNFPFLNPDITKVFNRAYFITLRWGVKRVH